MDWPTYKALCERPDVMPRALLERTSALLPAELADILRAAQAESPWPKPADHKGDATTDMFTLALRPADVRTILAAVEAAAENGRATRGMVAAWREARDYNLRTLRGALEFAAQTRCLPKDLTRL